MEFADRILLLLLWALLALGAFAHARLLWNGRVVFDRVEYRRRERPRDFWFIEAVSLAMLVGAAAALAAATRQSGSGIEAILYIFPFVWAGALAHALWHGWAGLAGRRFRRADRPRAYWAMVALFVMMCAGMAAFALVLYQLERHGSI
jgi:hypothetical protein